jgi:hypothetical protein
MFLQKAINFFRLWFADQESIPALEDPEETTSETEQHLEQDEE